MSKDSGPFSGALLSSSKASPLNVWEYFWRILSTRITCGLPRGLHSTLYVKSVSLDSILWGPYGFRRRFACYSNGKKHINLGSWFNSQLRQLLVMVPFQPHHWCLHVSRTKVWTVSVFSFPLSLGKYLTDIGISYVMSSGVDTSLLSINSLSSHHYIWQMFIPIWMMVIQICAHIVTYVFLKRFPIPWLWGCCPCFLDMQYLTHLFKEWTFVLASLVRVYCKW